MESIALKAIDLSIHKVSKETRLDSTNLLLAFMCKCTSRVNILLHLWFRDSIARQMSRVNFTNGALLVRVCNRPAALMQTWAEQTKFAGPDGTKPASWGCKSDMCLWLVLRHCLQKTATIKVMGTEQLQFVALPSIGQGERVTSPGIGRDPRLLYLSLPGRGHPSHHCFRLQGVFLRRCRCMEHAGRVLGAPAGRSSIAATPTPFKADDICVFPWVLVGDFVSEGPPVFYTMSNEQYHDNLFSAGLKWI